LAIALDHYPVTDYDKSTRRLKAKEKVLKHKNALLAGFLLREKQ